MAKITRFQRGFVSSLSLFVAFVSALFLKPALSEAQSIGGKEKDTAVREKSSIGAIGASTVRSSSAVNYRDKDSGTSGVRPAVAISGRDKDSATSGVRPSGACGTKEREIIHRLQVDACSVDSLEGFSHWFSEQGGDVNALTDEEKATACSAFRLQKMEERMVIIIGRLEALQNEK